MMKINKLFALVALSGFFFASCEKDDGDFKNNVAETGQENAASGEYADIEVEQFIYKGMNDIYLYKADVPELGDHYFAGENEKNAFLREFDSPEALFDAILSSQDRFSFLTDNYVELEESFKGISSSTAGMEFGLGRIIGTDNIFGYLKYVVPGTSAAQAGLQRGTVFTEVDGIKLTENNFSSLMEAGSFTINIGEIRDGTIHMTDETVTLQHSQYTENPVHIAKTLNVEGQKIGYLMYNSFVGDFDDELNAAFGKFKSEGITELILDLRYNGGGSVESAVDLASMITGQFEGEIFMKEQWNKKYQDYYEKNSPENLLNRFDPTIRTNADINSLNLSRVYVLTSGSTASASELVINGLEPYVDVVQIGGSTTGKFQASVTLYDSEGYGREDANENHTYAIQPLVFKSANAEGKSDYVEGLAPDIHYAEDISNMGILGDPTEPLLQAALDHLLGRVQQKDASRRMISRQFEIIGESGMNSPFYQKMYTEDIPPILP